MKQSILKKNCYQTNSEIDPVGSNSSLATSFQSNLENSRTVNTSKNVRFIGIDMTERSERPPDRAPFSITRPVTGPHLLSRNLAKKSSSIPMKQINFYSKPEDSITFVYQQNQANNFHKNKNHVFYYQQQQAQQLNKGLRITSASIENRLVKSNPAIKRAPNETSTKQSATSVTPIRTPILISNLLASANSLTTNSHEKNPNTSYYYYFNRSNPSKENNTPMSATSQNTSKSPANRLKFSNLERIGSSNDQGSLLSPRSLSDQKLTNILPINMRSATPSLEENNHKNSPSTLTLYTYLLQSNKKLPKDVRASIIRSQTKQLNTSRDEIQIDLKSKLVEDSNKRFRLKKDTQSDQFIKLSSRVSSASANTQLSNEENSLVHRSVPLSDKETTLINL